MSTLTIFSWGYWGWGNATPQLVQLVDSIEAARGFTPPLFVDIRVSRSVRARGFHANAFGDLIGRTRYRHMPSLGNLSVLGKPGPTIQIKDPSQARALLELAGKVAEKRQRLVEGDSNACHRVTVARLLLEASDSSRPVEIVEWPGGEPRTLELQVSQILAKRLLQGGRSIPLGREIPQGDLGGLAWGSVIRLRAAGSEFPVAVGPPKHRPQGWCLPVPWETAKEDVTVSDLVAKAGRWRREFGFEPRFAAE